MNAKESLQYLTDKLKSLKQYFLLCSLSSGIAIILTTFSALILIGFVFNALFFLSTSFRTIFVIVAAAILLGLLLYKIFWKIIKLPSLESLALKVEKKFPKLKNRLIASLQLEKNLKNNSEGYSTDMIQAVINQSEKLCTDLDFKKSVNHTELKRWGKYSSMAVVLVFALWLLFPLAFNESLYLFSHPTIEIPRQISYELDVHPKDSEVAKYVPIEITALLTGTNLPEKADLFWRYPDGKVKKINLQSTNEHSTNGISVSEKLAFRDSTLFNHKFREIKRDFEYWISAGEIESPIYTITVVDKPRVVDLKLTYNYPKYTGLKPLVINENDGNIAALKGTKVKLEAVLNKSVESASLFFSDNKLQDMKIDGQNISGTIKVMDNGSYHITAQDEIGYQNDNPIEYRIEKIADIYPEVDIVSPGVPVDLGDEMTLNLIIRLYDDFGFSKVNLVYRLFTIEGETYEQKVEIASGRSISRDTDFQHFWDLSDIGLEPGSWVEYYIEAYDNDYISGPKRGVSQTLTARLPSIDEMFAYLEEEGEEQITELERLKQIQEDLLEKSEQLQEELLTNQELDWEKRKQMEKALGEQQELMKSAEKVAENIEQMQEEMRENQLTSLEILQKLQEIQKLFEEVATEEMREAMRKMQEALKNMNEAEMQKAAEEMKLSQEELKKNLERTINLLKMLQIQQKMENMMRLAQELLQQQESVNEAAKNSTDPELPKLAPTEKRNKDKFDQLVKDSEELQELLKEMNLQGNDAAKKFSEAPKKSDAGKDMQEMAASLSKSQQDQSMQQGESASEKLKKMIEDMQQSKDSFNSQMGSQSAEDMKEAAEDLLYVSDQQENKLTNSEKLGARSPHLQRMAAQQQALEKTMQSLSEKLSKIGEESAFYNSEIGQLVEMAGKAMNQATSDLSKRNGSAAIRNQRDAMFSLNKAANQMMQSMQNQKQCSGGSCNKENMFQKMNSMSKKQQKLNNSTAMCNKNPQLGPDGQQTRLQQLAGEQAAIQKSMEELQKEQGNRPEILGRLDELAKEAAKVVEDLEKGVATDETMRRQNKIHSRMLDFQHSMERQDFSEERRAESGKDKIRTSPSGLRFDNNQVKESYQDRLRKYLNEKYPQEYEELVKEYFRAVNNKQNQ